MFEANEQIPHGELILRYDRCRQLLSEQRPEAGGLMIFSRPSIYYFTGCMTSGVFWLPMQGEPLLMLRKGMERAVLESPRTKAVAYRSYSDLSRLANEHEVPLTPVIAAEQSSLPWNLADNLQRRLSEVKFVSGDQVVSHARALKTTWELNKMRQAGARHAEGMENLLPASIWPGMTELEIAHKLSDIFYSLENCAIHRMNAFGEEMFFGEVSAGDNGNYPTFYNGPLGCRGAHPAMPYLGCGRSVWTEGSILTIDVGFCFEGYNSDKTLCYFAGAKKEIPALARKAHDVCREIEDCTAKMLKPGNIPYKIYENALALADKAGFGQGFMGAGNNAVPFLGHGIGLCLDEWPVLARHFERPLEAGMTLAVEPKIGLPGIGMVGSENTWEVTANGGACLSGGIRDIICVE